MQKRLSFQLVLFLSVILLLSTSCKVEHPNKSFIHPEPSSLDSNLILPPAWSFGVLFGGYTNQEQTIQRIEDIISHDYPIDAYWIDSWFWSFDDRGIGPHKYMDFVADTIAYPNRKEMWQFMHQNNIKGGFWVWDCIQKTGNEEAFNAFLERGYFKGEVFMNYGAWHNGQPTVNMFEDGKEGHPGTPTGNIDFENPEAVAYFKERMKHFFDEGADFIKLDRTAAVPVSKAMFEMTQEFGQNTKGRGFIMAHSHGTESEEFKRYPTKWTGDSRADWTITAPTKEFYNWVPRHALKENIEALTDPENAKSKIPFLTMDIGGFEMGVNKTESALDDELFIRWVQLGMFGPITEVFTQPENPTSSLAFKYSERADSIFRNYAHLRMKLFPYIYSYAHHARLEGDYMIRKIPGRLYEYNFGKEMLVAPVYEKGASEREVWFPEGTWISFWNGKEFEGNKSHVVEATISEMPLFVKKGAIIPMREYASSIETGSNDILNLHVFPGDSSQFDLIEDDGTSNDYLNGIYSKTVITLSGNSSEAAIDIKPALGYYEGMTDNREWNIHLHPNNNKSIHQVTLNGEKISVSQTIDNTPVISFKSNKYTENRVEISYQ